MTNEELKAKSSAYAEKAKALATEHKAELLTGGVLGTAALVCGTGLFKAMGAAAVGMGVAYLVKEASKECKGKSGVVIKLV
jgi:hypothetical protein